MIKYNFNLTIKLFNFILIQQKINFDNKKKKNSSITNIITEAALNR